MGGVVVSVVLMIEGFFWRSKEEGDRRRKSYTVIMS